MYAYAINKRVSLWWAFVVVYFHSECKYLLFVLHCQNGESIFHFSLKKKFENTKEVTRSRKLKRDKQYTDKNRKANFGRVSSSCSIYSMTHCMTVKRLKRVFCSRSWYTAVVFNQFALHGSDTYKHKVNVSR